MAKYDLKQFKAWIEKAIDNIESAIKETHEIQTAFNSEYVNKFKLSYDALLERIADETVKLYYAGGIINREGNFYNPLVNKIKEKETELTKKKKDLIKKLSEAEEKLKSTKSLKEILINELKKLNPSLNEAEEAQKIIVSRHEGSALTLKTNIAMLRKGLGFFFNYFTILKLKRNLEKEIEVLKIERGKLHDIRNRYHKAKAGADKESAELEEQYRENIEIAAAIRKDLTVLEKGFEAACVLESISTLLEEAAPQIIKTLPDGVGNIDELLKMREVKIDYEKSLKLVAEEIGFLTGIKSGFSNLQKTAESLLKQYNDYKSYLKPINFELPDKCDKFRDNFKNFADKIIDDNKLSKTPADFIKLVSPFHDELLNETAVKSVFEQIAAAIKTATKAWKK